jgi:hypothetical protein
MSAPHDPIVAEVRAIREKHAAQFGYDIKAIFRSIREQQKASGRTYGRYPAGRATPKGASPLTENQRT